MQLLQCVEYANEIKSMVRNFVDTYSRVGDVTLTVFSNPDDPASQVYLKNKKKVCEECGIRFYDIPTTIDGKLRHHLEMMKLHLEGTNSSFIVQMPSNKLGEALIENLSDELSQKDADGINPQSLGQLLSCENYNEPKGFSILNIACTPLGMLYVIKKQFGDKLDGKKVVIINRSNLVGKPIAKLLMDENCTVTICHSKSGADEIKSYCANADIIICAVGKAKYFNSSFLKPIQEQNSKVLILDVGINRCEGKLCGDVDVEEMKDTTSDNIIITTVPKGIGVMTTAMLVHNVCTSYGMRPWFTREHLMEESN